MLYPTDLWARGAISITFKHLQPTEHLAFRSISVLSVQHPPFGAEVGNPDPLFQRLLCGAPRVAGELLFRVPEEGM